MKKLFESPYVKDTPETNQSCLNVCPTCGSKVDSRMGDIVEKSVDYAMGYAFNYSDISLKEFVGNISDEKINTLRMVVFEYISHMAVIPEINSQTSEARDVISSEVYDFLANQVLENDPTQAVPIHYDKHSIQRAALVITLAAIAHMAPHKALTLVELGWVESRLNTVATNQSSTALGIFQIINPTYRSLYQQAVMEDIISSIRESVSRSKSFNESYLYCLVPRSSSNQSTQTNRFLFLMGELVLANYLVDQLTSSYLNNQQIAPLLDQVSASQLPEFNSNYPFSSGNFVKLYMGWWAGQKYGMALVTNHLSIPENPPSWLTSKNLAHVRTNLVKAAEYGPLMAVRSGIAASGSDLDVHASTYGSWANSLLSYA